MQELATKKQEENLAIVPIPTSSLTSLTWDRKGSLIQTKVNTEELTSFRMD
jgi:hypothetical protein